MRASAHLAPGHLLAEVAARHCAKHLAVRIGRVACGSCWELAIRDDERLVVECGLPREIVADPDYVDEIAVELACRGREVSLTPADMRAAVERMRRAGVQPSVIARRLHASYAAVMACLADAPAGRRVA